MITAEYNSETRALRIFSRYAEAEGEILLLEQVDSDAAHKLIAFRAGQHDRREAVSAAMSEKLWGSI